MVEILTKNLFKKVKEGLDSDADISDIKFEGCEIVLYTKNPEFFNSNGDSIRKLVSLLKKRIILRPDPSICLSPEKAKTQIKKIVPTEAGLKEITFEPEFGKVTLEAEKPGLVIGKGGETLREIKAKTLWAPTVKRAPAIPCDIVKTLRKLIYKESAFRKDFLDKVGKDIHSGWKETEWIRLTALGAFREVGRSCLLLQTPESRVLLDCGSKPGTNEMPYLNVPEADIHQLSAVVLSHAHSDHCLPPKTPVITENGVKSIENLEQGENIYGVDWKTGKKTVGKCSAKKYTNGHKHIYKVRTTFSNIEASPNHKFFVVDELKVKELRADQLKQGMIIPSINFPIPDVSVPLESIENSQRLRLTRDMRSSLRFERTGMGISQTALSQNLGMGINFVSDVETKYDNISSQNLDKMLNFFDISQNQFSKQHALQIHRFPEILGEDLAQCIGYVIGDGHKSGEHSMRMTDNSTGCLNQYRKIFNSIFNYNGKITHHSDYSKNAWILGIYNVSIIRFLEKNFPDIFAKSSDASVPEKIKFGNKQAMTGFLRGIADAEGCVTTQIDIGSCSHKLLEDIQYLFSCLGIRASISYKNDVISISSFKEMRKYSKIIGFSHPERKKKLKKLLRKLKHSKGRGELVPISCADIRNMLKDIGVVGRIHGSPKITDFPMAILDRYRSKGGYVETNTARSILDVLNNRIKKLEKLKSMSLLEKRKLLSMTLNEVSKNCNLPRWKIEYREKGFVDDKNKLINKFLDNRINRTIKKATDHTEKIKFLLNADVKWEKIKSIEKRKNPYDKLVDIEVEPCKSFIANNIVVHNSIMIPYLYEYGCKAPLYLTAPTRDLMVLLCLDYLNLAQKEGRDAPYTTKGIKEAMKRAIVLNYNEVSDITPDMRLTLVNSGHILGSSLVHIHIGDGLYNLLYTSDIKFDRTALYEPASTNFTRAETVITESTYGRSEDILPRRDEAEKTLVDTVNNTIKRKGKVLIPSFAVERAQDIMVILVNGGVTCPIYLDGMVWDATAIHTTYPEYMNRNIQRQILQGNNPFTNKIFKRIGSDAERKKILERNEPCVIISTSGMLVGGPSVTWLRRLAEDKKNTIVFVGWQSEMSLGRKVQRGLREIPMEKKGKTIAVPISLEIVTIDGLSGHSDYKQLINFIGRLKQRPERIICNHGEASKCINLSRSLHNIFRCETIAPKLLETIRLK